MIFLGKDGERNNDLQRKFLGEDGATPLQIMAVANLALAPALQVELVSQKFVL